MGAGVGEGCESEAEGEGKQVQGGVSELSCRDPRSRSSGPKGQDGDLYPRAPILPLKAYPRAWGRGAPSPELPVPHMCVCAVPFPQAPYSVPRAKSKK